MSTRSTPSACGSTSRTLGQRADRHAGAIIRELLQRQPQAPLAGHKFSLHFLLTEWEQVVDAWQLESWEAYRDVARLGRKTRLPEAQRAVLWSIFERVRAGLTARKADHARRAVHRTGRRASRAARIRSSTSRSWTRRRTSASPTCGSSPRSGGDRPNALFFAGDLGQRIFQQPFSWKALGVDIRGRSRTLRVNYRTSHQIRTQADRLLGPEVTDVDGNSEDRSDTVSVFNGPPPTIQALEDESEEIKSGRQLDCGASATRACCRTSSACSSAPRRNWTAHAPPSRKPGFPSRFSTSTSRPPAATSRSAPCTSPRGWSSAPWS